MTPLVPPTPRPLRTPERRGVNEHGGARVLSHPAWNKSQGVHGEGAAATTTSHRDELIQPLFTPTTVSSCTPNAATTVYGGAKGGE